jgi:hypothetical protein
MEKNLLRRMSSGKSRASRIWLFLVLVLLSATPALKTQAQSTTTLPTEHHGPWSTMNKTGWSQVGLASDPFFENLEREGSTNPANDANSSLASFENAGSQVQINFTEAPEKLSFFLNTSGGTFTGRFVVEEATTINGTYSVLREFSEIVGDELTNSELISINPSSEARSIRFRLVSIDEASEAYAVYLDQVVLTERTNSPEVVIYADNKEITSGGDAFVFPVQNANTTSAPITFTIKNIGLEALLLTDKIALLNQTPADQFEIIEYPTKSTLQPNEETTFKVVFKPTSAFNKTASILVKNNDTDEANYTINLLGTGTILPARIDSFTPASGGFGTVVEILGANFINVTEVIFQDGSASGLRGLALQIHSDSRMSVTVPNGAITGKITAKVSSNVTSESATVFTIIPAPEITTVNPTSGSVGTLITITGKNLDNFQTLTINGVAASDVTLTSSTQISAKIPVGANPGVGKLAVTTLGGTAQVDFEVVMPSPTITAVNPSSAKVGEEVVITGSNLIEIQSITFGNAAATTFTSVSSTELKVTVPTGASTGKLVVKTSGGTAQTDFTVIGATITSFTPASGPTGTRVTVTGSNFPSPVGIRFLNSAGTYSNAGSIRVDATAPAGTNVSGLVPSTAVTGKFILIDGSGATVATSATEFVVTPPKPTITSLSPISGPVGTLVTIKGSNLTSVTKITFGGIAATQFGAVGSDVQVTVPAGALTGKLELTTPGGTAQADFTVSTSISSFTPERAPVGTKVTVTGNFPANSTLRFTNSTGGYLLADNSVLNSASSISGNVPATAVTGKIAIYDQAGTMLVESTSPFYVAPTIISLSPNSGKVGTVVRITGTTFNNLQSITFNGLAASNPTTIDASTLEATVPTGATSGPLVITTTGGSAQAMFYVGPTITSLSPNSGLVGTKVTVKGSNLKDITAIAFNGTAVPTYTNPDANTITMNVPEGATTGSMTVTTLGGVASAPFTVLEPEPLPVELMDFAGKGSSKGITLTWKTSSEKDNAYFEVQASANPTKEAFVTIGRVDSKVTNSSVVQSYEFMDRAPRGPVTYYRLKQVDLDGASELSNVIAVKRALTGSSNAQVKVYPNPFVQNLNLEVEAAEAGQMNVVLYYVTGKKAFEQVISVERGATVVELPLSNASLSAGIYILTTEINGQVTTSRVVKQ